MNGKAGALAFLIVRTTRNRLAKQAARAKSPRYALGMIMGLAYFWFFFFRPGFSSSNSPQAIAAQSTVGGMVASFAGIAFAVTTILWWLLGGVANALAYQPAEMQLLFSAPLSRRQLIGYKVARTQVQLLFGALIWSVLMRRWGVAIAPPLRLGTAWAFFTVMSLHRMGAALVQNEPVAGGRRVGLWAARGVAVAVAAAMLINFVPPLLHIRDLGPFEAMRQAGAALSAPPASWVLAPFRLMLAPVHATSPGEWSRLFLPAVGIVALHLVWVLSMSFVPFEEAAASATADVAKRLASMRERRAMGGSISAPSKKARQWLPLKSTGWPAVAVAWKNTLALVRTGVLRSVTMVAVILFLGTSVARTLKSNEWSTGLAASIAALAAMMFILGPRTVRNDLRQDLLNLPLLKTYPLSGAMMVASQIASPVLLLSAFQLSLCTIAWWAAPPQFRAAAGTLNIAIGALVLVLTAVVFNGVAIAIQNAAALVFPAWVRLGGQAGGVEVIGQSILVTVGSLLAQALMLVLPGALGAGLYFFTRHTMGPSAFLVAGAGGIVVMAAELWAFVIVLGDVFDKLDPNALNPV